MGFFNFVKVERKLMRSAKLCCFPLQQKVVWIKRQEIFVSANFQRKFNFPQMSRSCLPLKLSLPFRIENLWIWICHSTELELARTADTPTATLHPQQTVNSQPDALPWPQVVVERKMRKILHRCNLHFFIYSTENWGLALDFIAVHSPPAGEEGT